MRVYVKVFTTGQDANSAGDKLTELFDKWLNSNKDVKITNIQTFASNYGWMVTVMYEL